MSAPILYTVSCQTDDMPKAAAWMSWLQNGHMAAVMAGGAIRAELLQTGPHSYAVQYLFPDQTAFDHYEAVHAPALRAEGLARFPAESGFTYSRTVSPVIFDILS